MRPLPKRPSPSKPLARKLAEKSEEISRSTDRTAGAQRIYESSRKTKWFAEVPRLLGTMAGQGERCMLCSGSESSDVEHFWPKAVYPEKAMSWDNFLWACTPCNRRKGDRFPLDDQGEPLLLNPVEDPVWEHFYIDQFGNLSAKWDVSANALDRRALETVETVGLDRQILQEGRLSRLHDLIEKVEDTLDRLGRGSLTVASAKARVLRWRRQPFHPDVADYFLNGPGREALPFRTLFHFLTN